MEKIDYLILGGGSAGCVLAARLSENSDKHVVLVEAGRDIREATMPATIRSGYPGRAYLEPENTWPDLLAQTSTDSKAKRYEQGRVLGGGSAINAMVANRGAPDDYDEWRACGADGWSGDIALKYFKKLERDCNFQNSFHGDNGPIPVRRPQRDRISPFIRAVANSLVRQGYREYEDQNAEWKDGVFPTVIALSDKNERVPTSVAYLSDAVRQRPNLRILTNAQALGLLFSGMTVIGATVATESGVVTLRAGQTIVSMGGIQSAVFLMRNGVGPAEQLRSIGVPIRLDHQGVGENLMDHPLAAVSSYLPREARMMSMTEHQSQMLLRYTSAMNGAPKGDMHVAIMGRTAWHAIGQRMGTLLVWVNKPYSRGRVTLRHADPAIAPDVDFRLLSDSRDLIRLKEGFRLVARTLLDPKLDGVRSTVFPTSYSGRVRKIMQPGLWNSLQLTSFGALLDAGVGRDALVHSVITRGLRLSELLADDTKLSSFLTSSVTGIWHASGTCKMGSRNDPFAVTDGAGNVHGIRGLRVCDSSIMPTVPRANTNLPTIMLAERIGDVIKEEERSRETMITA